MNYRDKLLAEMDASIQEIGRIAEEFQTMADDTREFLERHKAVKENPEFEWSRPEARVQKFIVVGKS